jgi:hypothetical protein
MGTIFENSLPFMTADWLTKLEAEKIPHNKLSNVRPDYDECTIIQRELYYILDTCAIWDLPPSVIRFLVAGHRSGVPPNSVVKSLLIAPFLPEANSLIQGILWGPEVPNNVIKLR